MGLGQMGPVVPMNDSRHGCSWYALLFGVFGQRHTGERELSAPGGDSFIGIDRRWVIFIDSAMSWGRLAPVLIVAIFDVVSMIAKKKMGGIHAAAVSYIADWVAFVALVTDKHSIGDGAIVNLVRETRCLSWEPPAITFYVHLPIPRAIVAGSPKPTVVRATLVDLCPKTRFYRLPYSNSVVVSLYEAHRLPFDIPPLVVSLLGGLCPTTAAAFAQFYSGFVRGIIHLSLVLSRLSAMPRDCFQQSPWFFVS